MMKTIKLNHAPAHCRGITIIEILMVLGVLALFLSFALPSASSSANRAELRAAVENVNYSLHTARNLARSSESGVRVQISAATEKQSQTISFSATDERRTKLIEHLQNFTLPSEIAAVSDHDTFTFDHRGLVETPGQILLVSRADESVRSVITVN
jgi:Tfp pilus assembly protein FimT